MTTENIHDTLRFQYENVPVTVISLKPIEEFTIHDSKYGPVDKGRELTVPQWVANVLTATNFARLREPEIKVSDLQKALWRETGESVLQTLKSDYYHQVRSTIKQLAHQNKTSPNDIRISAQSKIEQLFRDVLDNRLLKLMKLSLREERIRETKKKMTQEERWLFDRLVTLLRNWQKQVLEIDVSD